MAMVDTYANKHGRIPGRGLRPWLLIPKVFAVAALFGGLVAMAAIAMTRRVEAYPFDDASRVTMLRRVYLHVVVPGFVVAMLCGWGLALQHVKVFARQRWVWAKAASGWLLTAGVAISGYLVWSDGAAVDGTLKAALFGSVAAAALVIYFGRHKPRLGRKAAT